MRSQAILLRLGCCRNCGIVIVFGVPLDRLDDQVQFVRAINLSGHAVVFAWGDPVAAGEVVKAVDPVGEVVLHEEHDTGSVFHTREQPQMTGAKVEHGG